MARRDPPLSQRELVALRLAAPPSRGLFHQLVLARGGLRGVLEASAAQFLAVPRIDAERARRLATAREAPEVERELEMLATYGVRAVSLDDAEYPALLRQAPVPPPILYLRGRLDADDRAAVALVGARAPTQYGLSIARSLGRGLARAGITVVSGLAQGIDAAAMEAAADEGGRVVGVLGCGLSVLYPASARDLVPKILAGGALLSEYPMATRPQKGFFPERNSIIAALALGTVVVEAAERSGSLITAECALEAGRAVFAVPGDITRENSRGANRLIQAGAKLVMGSQDVLHELAPRLHDILRERAARAAVAGAPTEPLARRSAAPEPHAPEECGAPGAEAEDDAGEAEASTEAPLDAPLPGAEAAGPPSPARRRRTAKGAGAPPPAVGAPVPPESLVPPDLTPLERALLDRISHEEQALDALLGEPTLAAAGPSGLSMALLQLEMRGLVRKAAGNLYTRVW